MFQRRILLCTALVLLLVPLSASSAAGSSRPSGDLTVNLAFALPAIVFIGWLGWITLRDRRRGGGSDNVR